MLFSFVTSLCTAFMASSKDSKEFSKSSSFLSSNFNNLVKITSNLVYFNGYFLSICKKNFRILWLSLLNNDNIFYFSYFRIAFIFRLYCYALSFSSLLNYFSSSFYSVMFEICFSWRFSFSLPFFSIWSN